MLKNLDSKIKQNFFFFDRYQNKAKLEGKAKPIGLLSDFDGWDSILSLSYKTCRIWFYMSVSLTSTKKNREKKGLGIEIPKLKEKPN